VGYVDNTESIDCHYQISRDPVLNGRVALVLPRRGDSVTKREPQARRKESEMNGRIEKIIIRILHDFESEMENDLRRLGKGVYETLPQD